MTLARPDLLWLGLVAVPVVILHLVRRRRRRETVASLLLWEEVLARAARRLGLRALAGVLSLLLVLAAIAAGTLAAADPRTGSPRPPVKPLILAVAGSARMEGERWADAARILAEELDRKAPDDPVTLLLVAERPRLLARRETDPERVLAAFAAASPALERADWPVAAEALGAAQDEGARVVAIGVAPDAPAGCAVRCVEGESAGITGLGVRVLTESVDVLVAAAGELPGREVVLTLDGSEVARAPAAPEVALRIPRGPGGILRAGVEPPAGPEFDDFAEAVLPVPVRLRVGVVAEGGPDPFLRAALRVLAPLLDPEGSGVVPPERVIQARSAFDVLVVAGAVPEGLPPGDYVLLGPPPVALGFRPRAPLAAASVWESAPDHPVTRGVDTAEVTLIGAVPAEVPPDAEPLLAVPGGAVAAAGERDGVRYVWIGPGPGDSTLPVTGAWPLLVRNALAWFATLGAEPLPPCVVAGDTLEPATGLPPGLSVVSVEFGAGSEPVLLPVTRGRFSLPVPAGGAGAIRVRIGGREHETRSNVLLPSETGAVRGADVGAPGPDRSGLRDTERRLAPWLAAVAAALLLLEWGFGRWVRSE